MISQAAQRVAAKIGQFYLEKNKGNYETAGREVDSLRISKIDVEEDKVVIYTARPGLMIGKRAANIEALAAFLAVEVKIMEDTECLYDYLIPRPYKEYEY